MWNKWVVYKSHVKGKLIVEIVGEDDQIVRKNTKIIEL